MWRSTAWEEFDLLSKGHKSFQQKVMTHVPYILIFQSVQEKCNLVQHARSFLIFLPAHCTCEFHYKRKFNSQGEGNCLMWTKVQKQGKRSESSLCLVFMKETGFIQTHRSFPYKYVAQCFGIFQSKVLEAAFPPQFCTHTYARTHKHQLWNRLVLSQNLKHILHLTLTFQHFRKPEFSHPKASS